MVQPAAVGVDLTHSQKHIWIGQRLHPASPLYNMAFAFLFPAELDAELFCEAWHRVAGASDALRTRIVDGDSGASRPVVDPTPARTEVVDLETRQVRTVASLGASMNEKVKALGPSPVNS